MLKPLTKEQTESILRIAAQEFADKGYAGTAIGSIAKKAGVSVGVIYKYYAGKEDLFNACVNKSLEAIEGVIDSISSNEGTIRELAAELITHAQTFAKENPEYIRLYHQITVSGSPAGKTQSAELIESGTAKLYESLINKAVDSGEVRSDVDPSVFAFFFDNLLMMLHFSYACEYYSDRFRIYCGDDATKKDEYIREQLLSFLGGGFRG